MTDLTRPSASSGLIPTAGAPVDASAPVSTNVMLDELVDEVVARIERKVIDELERRGQRQGWAAF